MKTLPAAIDLEKAIIGAILIEQNALYIVRDKLSKEVFYDNKHQLIYGAIEKLDNEGKQIDMFTVQEKLKSKTKLDQAGGIAYITELTSKVATSAHIEYHSLIVLQKYAQRQMAFVAERTKEKAFDESIDVNETLNYVNYETEKIINTLNKGIGTPEFSDIVNQSLDEYYEREKLAKEGKVSGIPTPLTKLTSMTNGWQGSDLIILAGRPSMGKTAMALQSINEAIENDYNPLLFSLEMAGVRLVDRILCAKANIPMDKFRSGYLNREQRDRMEEEAGKLAEKGIIIDDSSNITMNHIRSKAIMASKEGKCDIVMIDYGQLVDASQLRFQSREQEVSYISQKSKQLAKDLNIPVMLLMQLNRDCEKRGGDKRPQLSDLRESGAVEQNADLVLMTYRPAYYGFTDLEGVPDTEGYGEIIISKQRNGIVGTVQFKHNESITRIYDYEDNQIKENNEPF